MYPLYFGIAIYYQNVNQSKSEEFYHLGNKETMKSLRYNSFEYQKRLGILFITIMRVILMTMQIQMRDLIIFLY